MGRARAVLDPAVASGLLGLLGRLPDRPPDDPQQRQDRQLEEDHQIDERPPHGASLPAALSRVTGQIVVRLSRMRTTSTVVTDSVLPSAEEAMRLVPPPGSITWRRAGDAR